MMETRIRSIVKALSWRFIATIVTFLVSWILIGSVEIAFKIGLLDTSIKFAAYYFHERAWIRSNFGKLKEPNYHI
jgi:adenylylsulfate kinase